MADLLIFIIPCAAVSVLAYVMGAAMGYIEGRRRAIRDGDGTDLRRFIPALAKRLDIEADAGEAEDFVRWAVDEALEEVRNGG